MRWKEKGLLEKELSGYLWILYKFEIIFGS